MKNLNSSIKDILIESLNRGVHDVPEGLIVRTLTDPFGEYRFLQVTVKARIDELVDRGFISRKNGFISLK